MQVLKPRSLVDMGNIDSYLLVCNAMNYMHKSGILTHEGQEIPKSYRHYCSNP